MQEERTMMIYAQKCIVKILFVILFLPSYMCCDNPRGPYQSPRICITPERTGGSVVEGKYPPDSFIMISQVPLPRAMVTRIMQTLNDIRKADYALFEEIVHKARANKRLSKEEAQLLKSSKIVVADDLRVGQCARAIILAVIEENPDTLRLQIYDINRR